MQAAQYREPEILFEGACAYALHKAGLYEIIVYSTNSVVHRLVGSTNDRAQAERVCGRLNAKPQFVREAYGLL